MIRRSGSTISPTQRLRDTRNGDVRMAAEWAVLLAGKVGPGRSDDEVRRRVEDGTLEPVDG
jgi:hypothetical protein